MERIRIGESEQYYEIVSIQPVDTGVLQIVFTDVVPQIWEGNITLYTSGGEEATVISGYDTLLIQDGQIVQLGQSNSSSEPVDPPEPQMPLYARLMDQMTALQSKQTVYDRAVMFAAVSFSDAQALQVSELYPDWSGDGIIYNSGDRIRYNDVLYKVLQDHTSQADWTPDYASSLFARVLIENPESTPEWEQPGPDNANQLGDRVKHNGKTWESTYDGDNVWEPGAVGTDNLWKEVQQ